MTFAHHLNHDQPNLAGITISNLYFSYGPNTIFENFSMSVNTPVLILEGPSGCGKTTLLKLLAGLVHPSEGSIDRPRSARIILQDDGLFPWLTVEGNLACAPDWKGFQYTPHAVAPLLHLIMPLKNRYAFGLSFGQRRIVELFRILSNPTSLICLDEPFNFLDANLRQAVAKIIDLLAQQGTIFAISTHYRSDVQFTKALIYSFQGTLPVRTLNPISPK